LGANADDFVVGVFDSHAVLSLSRHALEDLVKGGILGYRPGELAIDGTGGFVSPDQIADFCIFEISLLLPPTVASKDFRSLAIANSNNIPSKLSHTQNARYLSST